MAAIAALIGCTGAATGGPAVQVQISPNTAEVKPLGTLSFTATVAGGSDSSVLWSVSEADGGSITSDGVYTAPPRDGVYHVVARPHANPSAGASVVVEVTGSPDSGISVAISPSTPTVEAGGSIQFTAAVTGSANTAVTWSIDEPSDCGSITPQGAYAAPSQAAICHVIATSGADPTRSDVATITVSPPPVVAVAVSPHVASALIGGQVTFAAAVTGSANLAVVWSIQEGSGCGAVTQVGLYSAPVSAATCHVVATSAADPTKSDAATVTVSAKPQVAVAISPRTASVTGGGTVAFKATVTGATNVAVTWSVQESSGCGWVTQAGVYTAPAAGATCHVVATSSADASKSDIATVTVSVPVTVAVAPHSTSVSAGGTVAFKATVTGATNAAVTWSVQESSGCGSVTQAGVYTAPAAGDLPRGRQEQRRRVEERYCHGDGDLAGLGGGRAALDVGLSRWNRRVQSHRDGGDEHRGDVVGAGELRVWLGDAGGGLHGAGGGGDLPRGRQEQRRRVEE